jgi:MoxR-like ATPase
VRDEIRSVQALMEREAYVTDRATATAVYLAMALRKPLLIEGHPGVGKTEVARVLARALDTALIRLQCYEGLDASTALYEWNYPKQLLHIRLDEGSERPLAEREASIFGEAFLLKRPLLQAITQPDRAPVLLVDEVDRSDEEFEAFLLEVLDDYQVTIPEIGTVRATHAPYVVLTSNRARELSDALRRRCLYLWVDYPPLDKELRIVRARVPAIADGLALQVTGFIQALRAQPASGATRSRLAKTPGVAETIDWARALVALHAESLDEALVEETLGCFLQDEADLRAVRAELAARGVAGITGAAQ